MGTSIWEKFKWVFLTALSFRRTAYPLTKWGSRLILAALGSAAAPIFLLSIEFESGYVIDSIEFTAQDASLVSALVCLIAVFSGVALIYKEWQQKTRHTAKALIASLPGCSTDFPEYILDSSEKPFLREAVVLGQSDGNTENIEAQVCRYNAEHYVNILNRFVLHSNCQKLYIGGLARVPMLVAYGALLKNTSAEIKFFDKLHQDGKWSLLDDVNNKINIKHGATNVNVNPDGDIGLAVGFSSRISTTQLPSELREFTKILEPTVAPERNLFKNQDNLNEIADKIGRHIDELSTLPGSKRIHLFLSVQSSLAIAIGRRYQEGMHKNWVIHNYDAQSGIYSWSVEMSKQGIKLDLRNQKN
ncbi:SAVED domain-containing protein [Vibrio parahaemolyticus]|uniref:SAVED domain-containing protein n=1 Tax=Vibrio parahaemolyticus TaxID=670 RepID=UPI003B65F10D|nr:SAVED domain-containing protein [Vibrio parahaemolyticus]